MRVLRYKQAAVTAGLCFLMLPALFAQGNSNNNNGSEENSSPCAGLPTSDHLKAFLRQAPAQGGEAGGLFSGKKMWGAIVNKNGELCAVAASTDDPRGVWPGSQAIAKSKAYTANAFSIDELPLSTARLYTFTQPGHSLASLGQSNPFDPAHLSAPDAKGEQKNHVTGGLIFFGGGVPLYRDGKVVGGLGVSGDTACTDHEIAKRVRDLARFNPPGGALADDISYSSADGPSAFTHPACINTWRNGVNLGKSEQVAVGY